MTKPQSSLAKLPMKPTAPADADAFVNGTPAEPPKGGAQAPSLTATPIEAEEPTQRLTLEIPLSLHILIKTGTVQRRTKMKDEVLKLLEAHYRPKA